MTQSSASPEQQADDSSDDNVDDNLAPPAPSLTGSRCRSRAGQRTCALLGVKGSHTACGRQARAALQPRRVPVQIASPNDTQHQPISTQVNYRWAY
jgi:hypothetical protein